MDTERGPRVYPGDAVRVIEVDCDSTQRALLRNSPYGTNVAIVIQRDGECYDRQGCLLVWTKDPTTEVELFVDKWELVERGL